MIGPVSVDDPEVGIQKLLERHAEFCRRRNMEISRYHLNCVTKQESPFHGDCSPSHAEAFMKLSSWGYRLWKEQFKQSNHYESRACSSGVCKIYRISASSDGCLVLPTERCNCETRMSFNIQCRHEIFFHQCFIASLWHRQWY